MPPHLNKVETRKVAPKNADEFPDDWAPPTWTLVRRRGVLLGYYWVRNQERPWMWDGTQITFHVTDPDLNEIATFTGVQREGFKLAKMAKDALVERADSVRSG